MGQHASEFSADGWLVISYKVKWVNRTHFENTKEHVAVNCIQRTAMWPCVGVGW